MMNLANLRKRVLFAIFAIPIGWCIINSTISVCPFLPPPIIYPAQILAVVLVLMASYEYIRMLSIFYPKNGFWLSYIWLILQSALYLTGNTLHPDILNIFILLMLVAFEAFLWGKRNQRKRWVRASLFFSGNVFLYIAGISLLYIYREGEGFQVLFRKGPDWALSQLGVVIVVASIFLCDTFAYFVGSLFGKHHFSSISPNKTTEGSIAGLLAAFITSTVGWWFLRDPRYSPLWGILLGLLIGVFAQIGDLLVSLIKRYFKVKDSSDIIPGHGGILDRFDSVFFAAPGIVLFSWIVSRIHG